MTESDDDLHALLGAEPPASVLALDADARSALAGILLDARRRQSRALKESFSATLKHVPYPVRGIVKKVLVR